MSKLYFKYGAMNCGKTTIMIQTIYNYEEKGMKALLLKPAIDTKGGDYVINRTGLSRKVDYLIEKDDDFSKIDFDDISVIIVDEAQFLLPRQVELLYELSKFKNIPVMCYGLRCDFNMQPFIGTSRLLCLADKIEEIKTICKCGRKATHNLRMKDGVPIFDGGQVLIDGSDSHFTYESVCGKCYLEYKKESDNKNGRKNTNKGRTTK